MNFSTAKRADYLKLPHRDWDKKSNYESLIILKSSHKHDSGYAMMMVIGCNKGVPVEIAASCPDHLQIKCTGEFQVDCSYSCGAIRFHSFSNQKFTVEEALSSITIRVK